jgi:hypothetical protein
LAAVFVAVLANVAIQVYFGRSPGAGAFPEVVQLALRDGFCTGVVISDRAVLTAGHCVGTSTTAQIGSPDWSAPVAGTLAARHGELDLALFCTSTLSVAPAALQDPQVTSPLKVKDKVTIVGYGADTSRPGNPLPGPTKGTSMLVSVAPFDFVVKSSPQSACEGDSGGPAYLSGKLLVGTVHDYTKTVADCGDPVQYVRTDTPAVVNWIRSVSGSCP